MKLFSLPSLKRLFCSYLLLGYLQLSSVSCDYPVISPSYSCYPCQFAYALTGERADDELGPVFVSSSAVKVGELVGLDEGA